MDESQTVAQGRSEMVHEFEGRGTSAALFAVDDDEVRMNAGFQHGLDDGEELPRVAEAELEAGGFSTRELAQPGDEIHQLDGRRKGRMAGGRDTILARLDAANGGDFRGHLGGRQNAAMAGLGALGEFHLDHFDLRLSGGLAEFLGRKAAVKIAAAEIAGRDFPDDVASRFTVIGAEAAFAGVMGEIADLGAAVEGADGIGGQRAIAHGGNVENRGRIGLAALRAADHNAERLLGRRLRHHRMLHPLVVGLVDIELGAEGPLVERLLGALIDDSALIAREGSAIIVGFEEILAHLGADFLEEEAEMGDDGIIAQDRVAGLGRIAKPAREYHGADDQRHDGIITAPWNGQPQQQKQQCAETGYGHGGKARLQ